MRGPAAALKTYLSGFGIPAYTTESVPDTLLDKYITFPLTVPEWREKATFYAQIWYRTRSNEPVLAKADEILADIGEGKRLPTEDGYIVIWPETPAVQLMVDGDFRSAYLNLSLNAYQLPGAYSAPDTEPEEPGESTEDPEEDPEEGEN